MADYTGRYFSERDRILLHSINKELYEAIIQVIVQIYKICPQQTNTNIYGETDQSGAKYYFTPINITTRMQKDDINTDNNQFGPDRKQTNTFLFRDIDLHELNFFPEVGDLIAYNERFYEVNDISQEQMLGQQPDKSWSINCKTHYTRLSKLNVVPRQN
jgi:hypothetical protein